MTRAQRGASKNASNSVKQDAQNDALKKPSTRRKPKVNKENEPAPKVKNTRKGSVQPLQEKNSVLKAEKENKATASVSTAETDGPKTKIDSTNVTKRTKATRVHDNGKRIRLDENIVGAKLSEMPSSKNTNRRGEPAARKQPDLLVERNERSSSYENLGVSPIRPSRKQQKTTIPTPAFASPARNKSPDIQKPTNPVVASPIKTRSKAPEMTSQTTRPRRVKQKKTTMPIPPFASPVRNMRQKTTAIGTPTKPVVVPSTKNDAKLPEKTSFASPKTKLPRRGNKEKTVKPTPAFVSPAKNIPKESPIAAPLTKVETKIPNISVFASPKTTRPRRGKTTKSAPAFPSPVRNINKSEAMGTPQKSVVVSSTKNETKIPDISAFASPKTTRPRRGKQQKVTEPIFKAVPTSNVTVRRKGGKNSDPEIKATSDDKNVQGNAVNNPFVTTRKRGRNLETMKTVANEILKAKEPVISNVTKRRKEKPTISGNVVEEIEMDKVIEGVTRRKRLQSVNATKLKETNVSQIDTLATPARKRNGTKNKIAKIDDKVTKQLELSVDCNVAGDMSDQSNGSTVPVYKRTGNTNNNIVDSVFDFESNSQENTLNMDEQMQEVYAKLVRENKASVIKPKRKVKKGVTKSKTTVTLSKSTVQKIRSELKDIKQRSAKVTTRKMATSKIIPKPQETPVHDQSFEFGVPNEVDVVDLGVEDIDIDRRNPSGNDMTILSGKLQRDPQQTSKLQILSTKTNINKDSPRQNILPDATIKTIANQETQTIQKSSLPKSVDTSIHTPTKVKTYPSPKKGNPIFQSTPVQIAKPNDASPWRVPMLPQQKYSNDVFSRYTTFEKSPIKSSEISKIPPRQETVQPNKKVHQPLQTLEVKDSLQKVEKAKDLTSDIQNCFGFDNDDTDDEIPTRPSLPDVNTSFAITKMKSPKLRNSPKSKKAWLNIPQALLNIKQTLAGLRKSSTSVAPAPDIQMVEREKTQSKIPTHFGGTRNVTVRSTRSVQKESIITAIKKKKIETTTRTQELSGIENVTREVPNLFDTSWPEGPDHKHKSYTRIPKREYKVPYENKTISDDKSEYGGSVTQVRTKRTKQKDDHFQEELRKAEEKFNSEFLEVDNFEMIMEKST